MRGSIAKIWSSDARSMILLTAAEGASRLLSFAFYIVAARALSPDGFGVVRYTITFALIMFLGVQVVVKGIARELGASRGNEERTASVLGASVLVGAAVVGLSWLACVLASAAGLAGIAHLGPLLIVLTGQAAFQIYYAIGRGLGHIGRPAVTYFAGSALQLAALIAYTVAVDRASDALVLAIYGLSSAAPVLAYELYRPVIRGRLIRFDADAMRILWRTCAPLIAGQLAFVVWNSADQVWVQERLGAVATGEYGAARNLAQLFLVIPAGVGAALAPRVAELTAGDELRRAMRLAGGAACVTLVASALLAGLVTALHSDLLGSLYGAEFRAAGPALVAVTYGMTSASVLFVLSNAAVGWGAGLASTVGMVVAAIAELAALAVWRPQTAAGAGWAFAAGSTLGLIYLLAESRRMWRTSHTRLSEASLDAGSPV